MAFVVALIATSIVFAVRWNCDFVRTIGFVVGVRKYTIPQSGVQKLVQKLRDEDFLHWTEKTDLCVDYPEVKITATLNGQHKQVLEGCKAPGKVLELADEIDRISGSHRWTEKVR
jgi:hypothetical protein